MKTTTRSFERPVESYEFLPRKKDKTPLFGGPGITSGGAILQEFISKTASTNFLISQYEHMIEQSIPNFLASVSYPYENKGNKVTFENFTLESPRDPRDPDKLLYTSDAKLRLLSYSGQSSVDFVISTPDGKVASRETVKFARFPVIKGCKYDNDTLLSDREKVRRNIDPEDPDGYFIIGGKSRYMYTTNNLTSNKVIVSVKEVKGAEYYSARNIYEFDSGITVKHEIRQKDGVFYFTGKEGLMFNCVGVLAGITRKTQIKWNKECAQLYSGKKVYSVGKPGGKLEESDRKIGSDVWFNKLDEERLYDQITDDVLRYLDVQDKKTAKSMIFETIENARDRGDMPEEKYRQNLKAAIEHAEMPTKYFVSPSEGNDDMYDFTINMSYNSLCYMFEKLLSYTINKKVDNPDLYSNKKMKTSVRELLSSFVSSWTQALAPRKGEKEESLKTSGPNNIQRLEKLSQILTDSMESTFSLNSNKDGGDIKVFQTMTRQSKLIELRTCDVPLSKMVKKMAKREIVPDQDPYLCLGESPDGSRMGLVRSLSIGSTISTGQNYYITESIQEAKRLGLLESQKSQRNVPVIINGLIVGFEKTGQEIREGVLAQSKVGEYFRSKRRDGTMPELSCVIGPDSVSINTYCDRLLFPFLIVDEDQTISLTREDIKGIRKGDISIDHLFNSGVMELLDPSELSTNCNYSPSPEKLALEKQKRDILYKNLKDRRNSFQTLTDIKFELKGIDHYTHSMVTPYAFNSMAVANILHANSTIYNRVIGQSRKGVQAIGVPIKYSSHEGGRTSALAYPEISPTLTEAQMIQYNFNPGRGAIIAFITEGGENSEDSIIVNRRMVEMGAFRTITSFQVTDTFTQKGEDVAVRIKTGSKRSKNLNERWLCKPRGRDYEHLTEEGLPKKGTVVSKGDVLIGGISETDGERVVHPYIFKEAKAATVMSSRVEMDVDKYKVTVDLQKTNIGSPGDKIVFDWSQKFTMTFKDNIDMPFFEIGNEKSVVDIAVNSRSVIARDTQAWLWTVMSNIFALDYGEFQDATSGKTFDIDKFIKHLNSKGYDYTMVDVYDGTSGEILADKVFVGPSFFTINKHLTGEKQMSRTEGARDPLTGNPKSGSKQKEQSIRYPEQVQQAIASIGEKHGHDKAFDNPAYLSVCSMCSSMDFIVHEDKQKRCRKCPGAPVVTVRSSLSALYNSMDLMKAGKKQEIIVDTDQSKFPYSEPYMEDIDELEDMFSFSSSEEEDGKDAWVELSPVDKEGEESDDINMWD